MGLGFETTHEISRKFRGGDQTSLEQCDWHGAGQWLRARDRRALCGFPYGFMVYYFRHLIPDLKVVCVHRRKDEWLKAVGPGNIKTSTSFPTGTKSMAHFWEIYEHLMLSVTPPVLHLAMEELDNCKPMLQSFLSDEVIEGGLYVKIK
jgi:hypothetical protein